MAHQPFKKICCACNGTGNPLVLIFPEAGARAGELQHHYVVAEFDRVCGPFLLTWLFSENRRAVRYRPALVALALQFLIALLLLEIPLFRHFFMVLNELVTSLEAATRAGTSFVFGYVGGGDLPFAVRAAAQFVFAFQALPVVLVVSALTTLLFHWGVLQPLMPAFRSCSIGQWASAARSAFRRPNIFLGMVESPLLIRPYLKKLTRAELFMVMTGGMATIAGTVFVLYASLLRPILPRPARIFSWRPSSAPLPLFSSRASWCRRPKRGWRRGACLRRR